MDEQTNGHNNQSLVSRLDIIYIFPAGYNVHCIIGRDVLQYGTLNYDGPTKTFSFTF